MESAHGTRACARRSRSKAGTGLPDSDNWSIEPLTKTIIVRQALTAASLTIIGARQAPRCSKLSYSQPQSSDAGRPSYFSIATKRQRSIAAKQLRRPLAISAKPQAPRWPRTMSGQWASTRSARGRRKRRHRSSADDRLAGKGRIKTPAPAMRVPARFCVGPGATTKIRPP